MAELIDLSLVEQDDWLDWLKDRKSFRIETEIEVPIARGKFTREISVSLTACRQGKAGYWYGHKRVNGKLRRVYLGLDGVLTRRALQGAAKTLSLDEEWSAYLRDKQSSLTNRKGRAGKNSEDSHGQANLQKSSEHRASLEQEISSLQSQLHEAQATINDLKTQLQAEKCKAETVNYDNLELAKTVENLRKSREAIFGQFRELKKSSEPFNVAAEILNRFLHKCKLEGKIREPKRYRDMVGLARFQHWIESVAESEMK